MENAGQPSPSAARVRVEQRGAVARLAINRPPHNILDRETIRELRLRFEEIAGAGSSRLIELRGAGEQAFSAGADIRDHFPDRAAAMLREFHALIRALLHSPLPVVAAVRGHCLGGGMELAMASDFVIASEEARFGQPEIKVGAYPPVAAALLPRIIGEKRAAEMILTGEIIPAAQARAWGLVNQTASMMDFEAAVEAFEKRLLEQSPAILPLARRALRAGARDNYEAALRESERIYLEELLHQPDAQEGLQAFLEKRRPQWGGL